jgi:hypothetical protein
MRRRAGLTGILLATGIAAAGTMLSAAPVFACSCGFASGAPGIARDARVFTGTVTQVDDPAVGPLVSTARPLVVHVAVEKVYRGSVGAQQLVRTAAESASCGFSFEVGQRYTVFADPPKSGDIPRIGLCGGAVRGDIDPASYGLVSGTSPPAGPTSPFGTVVVAAGLVALVGAAAGVVLRVRRGARTPS